MNNSIAYSPRVPLLPLRMSSVSIDINHAHIDINIDIIDGNSQITIRLYEKIFHRRQCDTVFDHSTRIDIVDPIALLWGILQYGIHAITSMLR